MIRTKRTWRRRVMVYLFLVVGLYAAYCGLLFLFQTKLMFPVDFAGQAGDALPTRDTEVIKLATDEGTTTAWFVPAPGNFPGSSPGSSPAPLAVFFHGNAELIDHQAVMIDLYHALGVSVLMVEYRGYGHSEGTPSQTHIVADSVAVMEEVLQKQGVDTTRVVLHGRSIGGGLAAQVALRLEVAAVIVENTGAHVAAMAWRYGVPAFLVRSPLNTRKAFEQLDVPTLIMHGKHDEIFPVKHAHELDAAAQQSTLVLFDADHNTLPRAQEVRLYEEAIERHLIDAGVILRAGN